MALSLEREKPSSFLSGLVNGRMQVYKVLKDSGVALEDDVEYIYTRQFFNGTHPFRFGGRCNSVLLTPDEHAWLTAHDSDIVLVPRLNDLEDLEHQLRKDNLDWGDRCMADSGAIRNLDLTKPPYSTITYAVLVLNPNHITRSPVLKVLRPQQGRSQRATKEQNLEPLYIDYALGDIPYYLLHEDMRTVFTTPIRTPSPTSSPTAGAHEMLHGKRTSLFALLLAALLKISDYIEHHSENDIPSGCVKVYYDRLNVLEELIMFLPPGHRDCDDFGPGGDTRRSSGVFGHSPVDDPIRLDELNSRFEERDDNSLASRDASTISLWDGESLGSGGSDNTVRTVTETSTTSTATRPGSLSSDFWMSDTVSDDDHEVRDISPKNRHAYGKTRKSVDTGVTTVPPHSISTPSIHRNTSTVRRATLGLGAKDSFWNFTSRSDVVSPEDGVDGASTLSLEDGCSSTENKRPLRSRASAPILPRVQAFPPSSSTRNGPLIPNRLNPSYVQTNSRSGNALLDRETSNSSSVSSIAVGKHAGGIHQHKRERSDGGMGGLVGAHIYSRSYRP